MTETPTVPVCSAGPCRRPALHATICPGCLEKLLADLRAVPDLLDELEVTLTRQDVHGRDPMVLPPEPARTKDGPPAATTALAFRPHAADAGRFLHAVLDAWTAHLLHALDIDRADAFPPPPPPAQAVPFGPARPPGSAWTGPLRPAGTTLLVPTSGLKATRWVERPPTGHTAEMARWLARHPTGMAADPEAGVIVTDVRWAVEDARRVIFPRQTIYVGPCECSPCRCRQPKCDRQHDGDPVDLYATVGAKQIRCSACQRTFDVAERTAWLREAAEGYLLNAEDMSRALPRLAAGISTRPLTASMIRGYGRRGRITEHRPDPRTWTVEPRPMLDPETGDEVVGAGGGPVMVATPIPPTPRYQVGEVLAVLRELHDLEQTRDTERRRKSDARVSSTVADAQRRFLQALAS